MNLERKHKIWMSLAAAGSLTTAVLLLQRRRAHRTREIPAGEPGRLAYDSADCAVWHFGNRFALLPAGKGLRVEVTSPAVVRWTADLWNTVRDTRTAPINGVWAADLDTLGLAPGSRVQFTFFWPEANRWEGEDFEVRVDERAHYGGSASD